MGEILLKLLATMAMWCMSGLVVWANWNVMVKLGLPEITYGNAVALVVVVYFLFNINYYWEEG